MSDTIPASFYVEREMYERERRRIFGSEWLILGRTARLGETGGYIAEEIAGYPVFVAVDEHGIPWAYHNVCPHRAGPIFFPGRGHTDKIQCQYHKWCFSYSGELRSAPGFEQAVDFDGDKTRLKEVSMANWGGMMWVNLAGRALPLPESLGPMVEDCSDIDFDSLEHTAHITMRMNCNWKVFVDNYLETYHVEGTHPVLERHFDLDNMRVRGADEYTLQETRTRDGRRMRWFYRYPNIALQVLDDTLCWLQILPQSPNETMLVFDHYARPGVDDSPLQQLCAQLVDQDRRLCEMVQRNLESGTFSTGHLGPEFEAPLMWFRSRVVKAIGFGNSA